ncbi:MAG: hypothetical protein CL566_04255 [Alphaproteobacteria bacterium]|nr:hypothetical protein [Alphaproteobacteria bacterium]|tara:strand:+ start:1119 stop:1640 length:522 start_codon:yes stop_codon:yes gene_type:complete
MTDPIHISNAGRHGIDVVPGRALRLGDGDYPLFKPPAPGLVAAPDDCLGFLRELHTSLLEVFDIAARRWVNAYFDAVIDRVDAQRETLPLPVCVEGVENGHRIWCYAAYRPLIRASCVVEGRPIDAPVMFWLDDGPYSPVVADAPEPRLLDFLAGVAAPHHPFVRRPLAGLRG